MPDYSGWRMHQDDIDLKSLLDFDSCKKSANYVAKKLENKGIILRSMENYKMKNKLRMTIGSTAQNKKFIKEIKNILR